MTTTLHSTTIVPMKKALNNFLNVLEKAKHFSKENNIDVETFLTARLSPNHSHFTKEIQSMTDIVSEYVSRITGEPATTITETEKTIDELEERIRRTIVILDKTTAEEINDREATKVHILYYPGKFISGEDYAREYVMPNFYFHLVMAYAILRQKTIPFGQIDYLGELDFIKE